jgi:hypothetical protein
MTHVAVIPKTPTKKHHALYIPILSSIAKPDWWSINIHQDMVPVPRRDIPEG